MSMEITLSSFVFDGATDIVIPEGVTRIAANIFRSCRDIVSMSLPSTLRVIEHDAFNGCVSLRAIELPDAVSGIGKRAFRGCSSLGRVKLPKSLEVLEPYTFSLCKALSVLEGDASIAVVGKECFAGCKNLNAVPFAASIRFIGAQAFSSCSSLVEIDLEKSLEEAGQEAFRNCKGLKRVALPTDMALAGKSLFSGCNASLEIIGAEHLAVRFPDSLPKELVERLGAIRPQDAAQYRNVYLKSHERQIEEKQQEIADLEAQIRELQPKGHVFSGFKKKEKASLNKAVEQLERKLSIAQSELEKIQDPSWESLVEFARSSR